MEILPDSDDVSKYMTPGASIVWMDADGLHGSSNSAFPGAEMLGGQQVGPSLILLGGVGAAVALPNMARDRQMSAVAVDAASLRGVAQSTMVYAADHNDQMPDDLARLVADGMVSPRQLVSHRSGTQALQMTPELEKLAKDDFAKFSDQIAQHCDFVYLGKQTRSDGAADIVVAYEKPGAQTPDGITVAFADAHAEFVRWADVTQAFQATNDRRKKDGLTSVDTRALMQAAGVGAGGPP
jgi:competence protein ComGC